MLYTNGSELIADTLAEQIIYCKTMKINQGWAHHRGGIRYFKIFGNLRKLIMRDQDNVTYLENDLFDAKETEIRESGHYQPKA